MNLWPHLFLCPTPHPLLIVPFPSHLWLFIFFWVQVQTFPRFHPWPSLLPLHTHSRMILCTVTISSLGDEREVYVFTPETCFLSFLSDTKMYLRMVITLFINSQTQFQDFRRPSNLISKRHFSKNLVYKEKHSCWQWNIVICYPQPEAQAVNILWTSW